MQPLGMCIVSAVAMRGRRERAYLDAILSLKADQKLQRQLFSSTINAIAASLKH